MQYSRFFRTMMSLTLAAAMVLCAGSGALATVTEEVIVNDEDVTVNDDINVTTDAPIRDGVTVAAEAHSNDDDASLTVNGNVTAVSEAGGAAEALDISSAGDGYVLKAEITGNVTAEGDTWAEGVRTAAMPCWIPDPNGGESTREKSENVTVETTVNGDVSVTSGTQTATGVSVNTDFCTEGSVDLTVDGKVTAVSTEEAARGVSVFAQDSRDIHLKVTVTGEVNATGETFAFGVTNEENRDHPGIGVTTEINVLGGVNASAGDWACGIRSEGSKDSRTDIYAEGAVNAEANQATGMLVTGSREETGGYAQVVVNGEITATGTGEGSVAEGVYIEGNQDFNARIETGGGIRAEAEETAFGIDIATRENAEVNMVADGNVDAIAYGLARGVYVYSENEGSTANLTVWGDVTAESKGGERGDDSEELRSEGIDIDSRNSSMTVTINGNVKAVGEWGVGADLSTDYQTEYVDLGNYTGTYNEKDYTETEVWDNKETGEHFERKIYYNKETDTWYDSDGQAWRYNIIEAEEEQKVEVKVYGDVHGDDTGMELCLTNEKTTMDVVVDGTVSGDNHAIVLTDKTAVDGMTLTVWKVEPTKDGRIVEYNDDTANPDSVYTADEETAKRIQYIIRLEQPQKGGRLSTDGTTDYGGYNVAKEGDIVLLKIDVEPGYEIVDAFNGTDTKVELLKNEQGEYYLAVPRGGGVNLSVTLREIQAKDTEQTVNTVPAMTAVPVRTAESSTKAKTPAEAARELADRLPAGTAIDIVGIEKVFGAADLAALKNLPLDEQITILLCALGLGDLQDLSGLSAEGKQLADKASAAFAALTAGQQEELLAPFAAKVTLGGKQVDGYVIGLELTYADGRKEIRELMFAAANGKVVKA